MKTRTTLVNLATNLSNNTSSDNESLMGQLISDQHRYLIQRYFDNERTYTTLTVGAQDDLGITASLSIGATSATLDTAWPNTSCEQLVVFSSGEQRTVRFTYNSTAITWTPALTEAATDTIDTVGVQAYPIPATVSKIKNDTVTVGQLVYTPAPVQSIQEWTMLNALPYTSDIPNYFYIYNGTVQLWPIPSSSGNVLTFNYKARVPDLSIADYTTGTLSSIAVGDTQVTGVGTTWSAVAPTGVDVLFLNLFLKITPPSGDGIWYPIQRFESTTSLTLLTPIQNAPSATAAAYVIGQLPLLSEDFHDMLVFGALKLYFSSIVDNDKAYKKYAAEYDSRLQLLEDYAGTKSVNVDLGAQTVPSNPNLYLYAPPQ